MEGDRGAVCKLCGVNGTKWMGNRMTTGTWVIPRVMGGSCAALLGFLGFVMASALTELA
jgi:hypothetical protein